MRSSHALSNGRLFFHINAFFFVLTLTTLYRWTYVEPARSRAPEIAEKGVTERPVTNLHFHGDVRFTPEQRLLIEMGIRDVERTSCGLVKADVTWDMNGFVKHALMGQAVIVSATTEELVKFRGPDADFNLGLTVNFGVRWIFLVTAKLADDDDRMEWVTAHEITHAADVMDHVNNGLMETEAPWFVTEKPSWKSEDIALFCKKWRCDPEMFSDCRFR